MKVVLRFLAVFFLIAGLIIFVAAGELKEAAEPNEISFGIMENGEYREYDRGYIGGNSDAREGAGAFQGFGILAIVLGGGCFVGSFAVPTEDS